MKHRLGSLFAICWCALLLAGPAAAQSSEWKTLNQEVSTLYRQGKYDQGVVVAKKALEIAERDHGPEHPIVATSINNLAEFYRAQGQYAAAEPLHKRSLAIREKALGPEHPDVGGTLNNLAELYRAQGQYAEPIPERVSSIPACVDVLFSPRLSAAHLRSAFPPRPLRFHCPLLFLRVLCGDALIRFQATRYFSTIVQSSLIPRPGSSAISAIPFLMVGRFTHIACHTGSRSGSAKHSR